MNLRIKEIRLFFNLSQEEFGDKIKITRSHVSSLENGARKITDRVISDICREFNVNEMWLRTGEGDMLLKTQKSILESLSNELNLGFYGQKILECYLNMNDKQKEVVEEFLQSFVSSCSESSTKNMECARELTPSHDDIERELANYRLELEAEQKGRISTASKNTKNA